jgi:hypothetical protein
MEKVIAASPLTPPRYTGGAIAIGALVLAGLAWAASPAKPAAGAKPATVLPAPKPSPAPAPKPTPTPAPAASALPPLDLSDMRLWNWNGKWHASEWANANSPLPWRYSRVSQPAKADTVFSLDAGGAPQLQAQGGIAAAASGLWESEVTVPRLRDGLIVAPLWLYDPGSRDEIDFEFAGRKGLDVSIHAWPGGVHKTQTVRLFAGQDLSGKRLRFGIRVNQNAGTAEMLVNGALVQRWERARLGYFPSKPLKPWIEMWAANPSNSGFVQWAGRWTGLASGEKIQMTVHGYRYTAP